MTHENFKLHMDGVAAVYVSRHDNGTVFLYTTNTDGPEGAQQNVLVILDQDEAVKVANAMLGPIKVMSVQEHIADMGEPEYMHDAPPVLDDETIDALIAEPEPPFPFDVSYDPEVERAYQTGRTDSHVDADAAQAAGDTLGFERGYTAGFEDGCRYAYDGGDVPGENEELASRILKLEVDLFARDEINGTTF